MLPPVCKICRVNDLRTARLVAWLGADFVGLHAIHTAEPGAIRTYRTIAEEFRKYLPHVGTVLLTKIKSPTAIVRMMEDVRPTHLQLHTSWTDQSLGELRNILDSAGFAELRIISVISPDDDDAPALVAAASKVSNFILFDHWEGGTGKLLQALAIDRAFQTASPLPSFIAGGLSPENIADRVFKLRPFGVDVQSGVEIPDQHGAKDPRRVADFIAGAKGIAKTYPGLNISIPNRYPILSVALTGIEPDQLAAKVAIVRKQADTFHLDHSDGTITDEFITDCTAIATVLTHLAPTLPYDVHALVPTGAILALVDHYLNANSRLRAVLIHVDLATGTNWEPDTIARISEEFRSIGVSLGIALQAPKRPVNNLCELIRFIHESHLSEVSIVGPGSGHSLWDYGQRVLPILRSFDSWNGYEKKYGIGIDRLITPAKIRMAVPCGITRVVVGSYVTRSDQPDSALTEVKAALSGQRIDAKISRDN